MYALHRVYAIYELRRNGHTAHTEIPIYGHISRQTAETDIRDSTSRTGRLWRQFGQLCHNNPPKPDTWEPTLGVSWERHCRDTPRELRILPPITGRNRTYPPGISDIRDRDSVLLVTPARPAHTVGTDPRVRRSSRTADAGVAGRLRRPQLHRGTHASREWPCHRKHGGSG